MALIQNNSKLGEEIAHPDGETASFARQAQKLSLVMEKNVAVEDVEELYYGEKSNTSSLTRVTTGP